MSDFTDEVEKNDDNLAPPPGSDYEVAFSYHSESQLERAYDKAEHWVKAGVKPQRIFRHLLDDHLINLFLSISGPSSFSILTKRTAHWPLESSFQFPANRPGWHKRNPR